MENRPALTQTTHRTAITRALALVGMLVAISLALSTSARADRQNHCPDGTLAKPLRAIRKEPRPKPRDAEIVLTREQQTWMTYWLQSDEVMTPAEKQAWKQYKNTPRTQPQRFKLFGEEVTRVSHPLAEILHLEGQADATPIVYEERVLGLRKGDMVQYSDRSFVLGNYLGAGNATQVFEIQGQPDRVLRISMAVHYIVGNSASKEEVDGKWVRPVEKWQASSPKYRYASHTGFAKAFARYLPSYRNAVKILEQNTSEGWIVAEKIQGKTTGTDFLSDFTRRVRTLQNVENKEWERFYSLVSLLAHNGDIDCASGTCVKQGNQPERQYLFDDLHQQWRVVDGESRGNLPRTLRAARLQRKAAPPATLPRDLQTAWEKHKERARGARNSPEFNLLDLHLKEDPTAPRRDP